MKYLCSNQKRRRSQSGSALMIVLILLVVLSSVVLLMAQNMRHVSRLAIAQEDFNQAQHYLTSASTFSRLVMEMQWKAQPARDTLEDQWAKEPTEFPLDNGFMTARLQDETTCFNVNSLVVQTGSARGVNTQAVDEFKLLLSALDIPSDSRATIIDSLVDWLDSDTRSRTSGAEDFEYQREPVSYRTGNGPIVDKTELRSMYWLTPELYERLSPFVCVHPSAAPSPVNINMVTKGKVPVLYAMLGGAVSLREIERLIEARPQNGFQTMEQFWGNGVFLANPPDENVKNRPVLWSKFIVLDASVVYGTARLGMRSRLQISKDGQAKLIAQKFESN